MFRDELNQATDDISSITGIHPTDLKLLAERYPYCQTAQILYTKKLHHDQNPGFEKQLQKTSAIVYDRSILFHVIEKMPLQQHVVAGFEQDEPIAPILKEELAEVVEINETPVDEPVMIDEHISEEKLQDIMREEEIKSNDITIDIDEPVVEIQTEIPTYNEPVEEIIHEQHEEVAPVINEVQDYADIQTNDEEVKEEIADTVVEPISTVNETILPDEIIEEEKEVLQEENKPDEQIEEPIFELPGYQIERELGKLDEAEEIRIEIRRPELTDETETEEEELVEAEAEAPVPITDQHHSFTGWLKLLAGESKGRVVVMKTEQRPKQLYEAELPITGETELEVVDQEGDHAIEVTEDIAGELARKSIEPDDRLVTETYARILYMQGKINKAIEVYEQLSLKKPEKSDYFAALIEQLKKRR